MVENIKYFLLDMDGTLYIGDSLIGDMKTTLSEIRRAGKKIIYLTNNSSKSVDRYVEKLTRLGLFDRRDEVYSSGVATIEYLKEFYPGKSVYLLGTNALKAEFSKNGIALIEEKPDICVLSYDTELTYEKLCKFTTYIQKVSHYIATHPDVTCPAPDKFVPDVGSFIEMIKAATGLLPSLIIGKPYDTMGKNLMRKYNAERDRFLMAGDRLYTDIKFGNNCGFCSCLVLSGESSEDDINENSAKPDFILKDFNEIVKYL